MSCSTPWCGAECGAECGTECSTQRRTERDRCDASRRRALRRACSAAVALALAPLAAVCTPARAQPSARDLPPPARAALPEGRVAGSGRLTYFGLHVYDAHLYVPPGFDPQRFADQPFALELAYARKLDGRLIAERSRDEMARLGAGSDGQRERWLAAMTRLFPDVDKDRRLLGINLPGVGARFYADDRPLGTVDDPAFARAFFAIWLDEKTSEPRLRAQLLAQWPPQPGR